MSDAFMIAICGGQKCIDKAQAAYFKRKSGGPNYLRLLASVVGKNLWDFVYNADLSNWKEVMATLCTFADQSEFPDLCEALGDRLEELVEQDSDKGTFRKDATFCYLAGSKLEKVVGNWAQELEENENAGLKAEEGDSNFSIHARSLQNFIEKVTVFRQATKFEDTERKLPSDWKLAPLYAKYTEYADVAAAHGQLQIAEKYLDLLPEQYPAAEVARNRVKQATRKAAPQATQRQTVPASAQRGQRVMPSYGATPAPTMPTVHTPASATSATPYTPLGQPAPGQAGATPYAPLGQSASGQPSSNPYAPAGYQPPQQNYLPQQQSYQPPGGSIPQPPQFGMGYQQPAQGLPPPPRGVTSSPSIPPPSKSANLAAWNDTPDFGSKPVSRRGTPGVAQNPVTSPFPNSQAAPAPGPPMGAPPRGPPRVMSPPSAGSPLGGPGENRPPSSAMSSYTPAPGAPSFQTGPGAPPRISSPYNAPPSSGPPTNRYAPAPGTQPSPAPSSMPPQRQVAPPPTQYAPPNAYGTPSQANMMVPNEGPKPPPGPPPRSGPPQGPPKSTPYTAPPPVSTPTPEPENRSAPPKAERTQPKYREFFSSSTCCGA